MCPVCSVTTSTPHNDRRLFFRAGGSIVNKFLSRFMFGFALFSLAACSGGSSSQGGGGSPNFRVDISTGTTGQLFVSWDEVSGATYYNLQRSTNPNSGYALVDACSGTAGNGYTQTSFAFRACRDNGLSVGTTYYYEVQSCTSSGCSGFTNAASNVPVASNCSASQMPDVSGINTLPVVKIPANTVDATVQFLPTDNQLAGYSAPNVARRDTLVVLLPGSGSSCGSGGVGAFGQTAEKLGFDIICVDYSNNASQGNICSGDPDCFGNVSQAKFDAAGPCSAPNGAHCGTDPTTGQRYVNSNPADAVTQRVSMMLQYLNGNGYNQNGTNWGNYLSGSTPLWNKMMIGGFSQGGDMGTYTGYQQIVDRAFNLSAPPQATAVNGVMTAATYFSGPKATNIRNFYGFVSVNDPRYQSGIYAAVWNALGFTAANNDAEVKLNTSTPIGLNCNSGTPSHNFSTSAPVSPDGGHADTLYLWNEDVFKFMLID